jgi:hypothetical protein
MASANQRTGQVYVRVGGNLLPSLPGATLKDFAGVKRTPVVGTKVHGFMEETLVPTIECEVSHGADVSVDTLMKIVDATATFECDSGPTFVLSNAWVAEASELKDGKLKVVINAKACVEQGAS